GRRPRRAGSDQGRARFEDAAYAQADGAACRTLAAAARRGGASVVELLPRDQETRRGDRNSDLTHDPEKCAAVFRKACPRARPEGSCAKTGIWASDLFRPIRATCCHGPDHPLSARGGSV